MELGKIVETFQTKKGNEAIIRYPQWSDLDGLLSFANALSKEDTFVQLSGEEITRDDEIRYLSQVITEMERETAIPLVATVNGKFAANCGIAIDKKRKKHVGLVHLSVTKEFREEGLGKKLLLSLISEAKSKGLKLLTLTCIEGNDRALHVYESVGFKQIGVIPKSMFYHGSYVGEIYLYLPLD